MIYIGVDPGIGGAMAVLYDDGGVDLEDYNTPANVDLLNEILDSAEDAVAVIEKQWLKKGDPTHMGKLIQNYGEWIGRFDMNHIVHHEVAARTWKALLGVTADKKQNIEKARLLFPEVSGLLTRVKDHNRAEALLIAEYCRRTFH
jgi:Holliday junction resolvasome RuvABC endonuclease subunit